MDKTIQESWRMASRMLQVYKGELIMTEEDMESMKMSFALVDKF